jgi:hypothetical protein
VWIDTPGKKTVLYYRKKVGNKTVQLRKNYQ